MKIGLITTLNTNIGDDFIREGLCNVLRGIFPAGELEFVAVNKHQPLSLYPAGHPLVRIRNLPVNGYRRRQLLRCFSRVFRRFGTTRFDSCDAIIQCGAPVYWKGCGTQTDWREDLWQDVVARLHQRIPVLNLAAGACYAMRDIPSTFETPEDRDFVRWLYGLCRATAVRDPLARDLLHSVGCEAELITCSAFLFTTPAQAKPVDDGPILFNYMEGGGHYEWGQTIDKAAWERTARTVISSLRQRYPVAMLCHNEKEKALAQALAPDLPQVLPATFADFPRAVAKARGAVCNRMHASVALGGMGIPAVTVGTDTRLLMVKELGMPCHFVADVTAEQIVREVDDLVLQRGSIAARLRSLQEVAHEAYARVFKLHLPVGQGRAGNLAA